MSSDKQVTILLRRFSRRAMLVFVPPDAPLSLSLFVTATAIGPYDKRAAHRIIPRFIAFNAYIHACAMAAVRRGACAILSRGPTTAATES